MATESRVLNEQDSLVVRVHDKGQQGTVNLMQVLTPGSDQAVTHSCCTVEVAVVTVCGRQLVAVASLFCSDAVAESPDSFVGLQPTAAAQLQRPHCSSSF